MFEDEMLTYKVVVNDEDQYSIWPADRENPRGWRNEGSSGSRDSCLAHIAEVWRDLRPASLRRSSARRPRRPLLP